ncbi:hypothetical protein HMI54_012248 [Coelomomyces lativittatus]|nr:hypothetical protein HMI55_005750 [Coelomomyces lativittatus]KAJ1498936.1 hypothetical protein HMI54_012248 [Coelomomyces lativittatus]
MQDIVLPEHAISLESITRQGMADCKLHPLEVTVPNILLDQPVSLQFVEGSFDAFISCFQTWLSTFPSLPPPFLDCISTLTTYAQQVRKCCVSLFETPPNHFQNFEWISKLKSMMKIHAQLKALLPPTFTHSFTFVGHQCHLHFLLNQNVNEWIKTLVITILNLSNHIWAWYLEKQQRMLM